VEFSLDTLEDLFLEGEVEQVKNDSLILAKEFTTKDTIKICYLAILKTIE